MSRIWTFFHFNKVWWLDLGQFVGEVHVSVRLQPHLRRWQLIEWLNLGVWLVGVLCLKSKFSNETFTHDRNTENGVKKKLKAISFVRKFRAWNWPDQSNEDPLMDRETLPDVRKSLFTFGVSYESLLNLIWLLRACWLSDSFCDDGKWIWLSFIKVQYLTLTLRPVSCLALTGFFSDGICDA